LDDYHAIGTEFEDKVALSLAVFLLFVLIAVAIAALGYGIVVEGSVRRAGKSRRLNRQSSGHAYPHGTQLPPPFDDRKH